jgi:phosphohistidine phosphatase SixA
MKMLIMRHGIAEQPRGSDFTRKLTKKGVEGVQRSIARLKDLQIQPTRILTSPLTRAQETAMLVMGYANQVQSAEVLEELSPSGAPEEVVSKLNQLRENAICLLVSHQPFVSIFVEYLTTTRIFLDAADIACVSLGEIAHYRGEIECFIHE